MEETPAHHLVKYGGDRGSFITSMIICANPDCDCEEVHLHFTEVADDWSIPTDPTRFTISVDLNTWQDMAEAKRPTEVQALVDEFLGDLGDDFKQALWDAYRAEKKDARRAASFSVPAADIRSGRMISIGEVYADDGSILAGGSSASWMVELDGARYAVEDLYCADPSCDCNAAQLVFLELGEGAITELFSVKLSFRGDVSDIQSSSLTKKEARRLISLWREQQPDLIDLLRGRYDDIKAIGTRILAQELKGVTGAKAGAQAEAGAPAPGRRVGRNQPCPCGSGKKHKMCCGRPGVR